MPTVSRLHSSIKRLHRRFFPQYVSKSSCLKKNILRKKFNDGKCFTKVEDLWYKARNFIKKTKLMLDPSVEALKILMYLQKSLSGGFFSVKLQV